MVSLLDFSGFNSQISDQRLKLLFVVSMLGMQQKEARAKTGWLGIKITCQSEAVGFVTVSFHYKIHLCVVWVLYKADIISSKCNLVLTMI